MKKILCAICTICAIFVILFVAVNFVSKTKVDVSNSRANDFIIEEESSETVIDEQTSNDDKAEERDNNNIESQTEAKEEKKAEELWDGYGIRNDDFDVVNVLEKNNSNFLVMDTDSEEGEIFFPGTPDDPNVYRLRENSSYTREELSKLYDENFEALYKSIVSYFGDDKSFNVLTEYLDIYVHSGPNGFYIYDYKPTQDAFYVVIMRGRYYYHFALVRDGNDYALLNYMTEDYFQSSLIEDVQDLDNDPGED